MEKSPELTTWLTPTQAALRLGVSAQSIREYVRKGKLRAVWVGRGRLIDPESVERLAREREERAHQHTQV